MDLYEKVSVLGPTAQYDTCGPKDFGQTSQIPGVYEAKVGRGVCRLFKVLQSSSCRNNCTYCALRRDRETPRVTASPDEMAKAFISAWRRRLVDGLFLSSGIFGNAETTMSRMLDTATILRSKMGYRDYIHLKIMPDSPADTIRETIRLANRISLNIEAPTENDLANLSPEKNWNRGLFYTLTLIKNELRKRRFATGRAPSLTTQFVVGAGQETDQAIVKTTHLLYKNFGLYRSFFSAFRPIEGTPLAEKPAASSVREHRLYQTDFLLRQYRFAPWDIPFDKAGFLPEGADPKLLWAHQHPEYFPINLNTADYWRLLKVPGVGPASAKKIIELRKIRKIKHLTDLTGKRIQVKKTSEFAMVN